MPTTSNITLDYCYKDLNVSMTYTEAVHIEMATQQQSQCSLWINMHKNRITASNFGKVISRKSTPTESFLNNIFHSFNNTVHAKPIDYGHRHENDAKA